MTPALCEVVTDRSEPRRREEELRRQTGLLAQVRAELERHAAELARSNAGLERFASVLAHDLYESLRAVVHYARLVAERYASSLDDRAQRYLGRVLSGAKRLDCMIEGLRDFSRVTTHSRSPAPADCETIFERACADPLELIERSRATVTHELLSSVLADETQLSRVRENLLSRAVKIRAA